MERLAQEAESLFGVQLNSRQIESFRIYARELNSWNQRLNLTAIRDPGEVRIKHFLDSLSCLTTMQGTPMARVADVGSGAGFPGLPLKIVRPDIHLTLIESVSKKAKFLEHIVQVLGLGDVEVLALRAEQVGRMPAHREQYDWAVARAVAALPVLVEYLLPLVKIGGKMLAQKGETVKAEMEEAENAMKVLGGRFNKRVPVQLPGLAEERYLVVIEKVAPTPEKYPRREGMAAKRPL